jgi:prevent-host-death family protein
MSEAPERFATYWGTVPMIDASTARQTFRDVVDRAARQGQRLIVMRNGRPAAAIVSLYDLDRLMRREADHDERLRALPPFESGEIEEGLDFDDFVKASRERRARKAKKRVRPEGEAPAEIEVQGADQEPVRSLQDEAFEAGLKAMASFLTERVAEIASEVHVNEVKERIAHPQPIEAGEEVRMKEDFMESVRFSAMHGEGVLAAGGG